MRVSCVKGKDWELFELLLYHCIWCTKHCQVVHLVASSDTVPYSAYFAGRQAVQQSE